MVEFSFFANSRGVSVAEIAALTGANPCAGADLTRMITGIAPIDLAGAGDVTFVKDAQYAKALATSRAGTVLTTERFAHEAPAGVATLIVRKPYEAFVTVARHMYGSALRPVSAFGTQGIAPSAVVHPTAQIGPDVTIDPFVVIGPSAKVGAGSLIAAHAMIGERVEIGADCAIGAGCAITHAHVGDRVVIHPGCHIGQDGFGYVSDGKGHIKIPQIGRVIIHNDVEIGSGTKIDNLCQIGHNCLIGRHCIIVAQSGLSGSVTIEDFVVLGPRTGIIPHITVGKGAMLLSRSTVYDNVPPGAVWGGFPAQPRRQWLREILALRNLAGGRVKK
jgi:UDP-3-O-[3-hydroxymyristoyl] glucosamine N-acyltransferase